MQRRQFIRAAAALSLAAPTRLLALPNAPAKLLVVFLRGGYDAANVLVPLGSDFYYEARPNIAIARPGSGPNAALPLDADWGLHPALADSLQPLYARGELAFVPFCGTDDRSRSHFATQDGIELGQALSGGRDFRSGFMNRLVATMSGTRPIAFSEQVPLILRGAMDVPNVALRTIGKPGVDARQSALIAAMYRRTSLAPQVTEGFGVRDEVLAAFAPEMEAASRNAPNPATFLADAHRIGKLLRDRFDVGFVDVGGWDTHVGEGAGTGYLGTRLTALGQGLAAIAQDLGPAWRRTVIVVLSEFGRTFRENGNKGTDHGHGSVYWVLGGAIRGGRVAGEQVKVARETLFEDRDYPIRNEYREVLGGLFARLYDLDAAASERVFPGTRPRDLGLV